MGKSHSSNKADLLVLAGAFLLACGERYVVGMFFATPEWEPGVGFIAAAVQCATAGAVSLVLLITVLAAHAREQEGLRAFLFEPVEEKDTAWRCSALAFVRYMVGLAVITAGLAALGWHW